jgi:hypothetical protein
MVNLASKGRPSGERASQGPLSVCRHSLHVPGLAFREVLLSANWHSFRSQFQALYPLCRLRSSARIALLCPLLTGISKTCPFEEFSSFIHEEYYLLRNDAIYSARCPLMFRKNAFLSFSILKMEAVRSSETLVNICHASRRHIPDDSGLHSYRCVNLQCYIYLRFV